AAIRNSSSRIRPNKDELPNLEANDEHNLCHKQTRLVEQKVNKLVNILYSKSQSVHILTNIKRISRDYIQNMYQLVDSALRQENDRFKLLSQEIVNLESELNLWERDYDRKILCASEFDKFLLITDSADGKIADTFYQEHLSDEENSENHSDGGDTVSSNSSKDDEHIEPVDMSHKVKVNDDHLLECKES